MNFKYDFVVDKENKVIEFAGRTFRNFRILPSANDACSIMGIYPKKRGEHFKEFTAEYGITPSNFRKKLYANMMELWVDSVKKDAQKYCYGQGGWNAYLLKRLHDRKESLEQCKKDGIFNIEPFVFYFGKSPKELRELFGKSLWKSLCKNSMTRNLLIAKHFTHKPSWRKREVVEAVKIAQQLPSSILKRGANSEYTLDDVGLWVFKQAGICKDRWRVIYLRRMANDTRRMAERLGRPWSLEWSVEKMEQKHSEYAGQINKEKFSPEPYPHLENFKMKEFTLGEYSAILCQSPLQVVEEGQAMHHCVGSYSGMVAKGHYLVYSIRKNGKRSSTLGVRVTDGKYSEDQHYGVCNTLVEDPIEIRLVAELLKCLNVLEDK